MSRERLRLVVGLGNPGEAYAKTRHNAGFMVVDDMAAAFSIPLEKSKFNVLHGRGCIDNISVMLAKPMAFMNRSGPPVQQIANYFRILSKDMVVIHDDIDLAFGRLKLKAKGGHGGHKGIQSLMDAFGGGDFVRLRLGVGRSLSDSENRSSVTDHVLGKFNNTEAIHLDRIIRRARDVVFTVLCQGVQEGMNKFNTKEPIISD